MGVGPGSQATKQSEGQVAKQAGSPPACQQVIDPVKGGENGEGWGEWDESYWARAQDWHRMVASAAAWLNLRSPAVEATRRSGVRVVREPTGERASSDQGGASHSSKASGQIRQTSPHSVHRTGAAVRTYKSAQNRGQSKLECASSPRPQPAGFIMARRVRGPMGAIQGRAVRCAAGFLRLDVREHDYIGQLNDS